MSDAQAEPNNKRTVDQIIGANVHQLMWLRGETQTKIAPLWGMDQTSLSVKLRGKRPWFAGEIQAAADRYGVSVADLFSTAPLPHLDSNQEPTGYTLGLESRPVLDIAAARVLRLARVVAA